MLPKILDALSGRPGFDKTDIWLSQNGFAQMNRRATSVLHLNMLFSDLDTRAIGGLNHWLAKLSPELAAQNLVTWCADEGIPMPSLVVWSGNGLHPKWLFSVSAPRAAKPVWDALQLHLVKRLKGCGWPVDVQARDVPRILRMPGTVNQKGGELCRVVWVNGPYLEHCQRYDFNQLADGKTI
ncbi:MAG: replication protein, partial [Hydrogenophilales bacterium CG18_big_fil_WC_8_21_14_2_50_58_12]